MSTSTSKTPKIKVFSKFERLEEARKAYKWWEAPTLPGLQSKLIKLQDTYYFQSLLDGVNWRQLEHPGVVFTPKYIRHNVEFRYDGEPVHLTDEQEEIATFYASIPDDGPQLGNAKVRKVFQTNFFNDFKESLGAGSIIKQFDKCDFTSIKMHLDIQKTIRKAATDDEKLKKKLEKESIQLRYGYALIDGRMEKVYFFLVYIV